MLELIDLCQNLLGVRQALVVDALVPDDALFIDDEDCPSAHAALVVVHTEGFGDLPLGMEVGQDGIRYASQ